MYANLRNHLRGQRCQGRMQTGTKEFKIIAYVGSNGNESDGGKWYWPKLFWKSVEYVKLKVRETWHKSCTLADKVAFSETTIHN